MFTNQQVLSLRPIPESLIENSLEHYSTRGCRYLSHARCGMTRTSIFSHGDFSVNKQLFDRFAQQVGVAELILCSSQLAYTTFVAAKLVVSVSASHKWAVETLDNTDMPSISTTSTLLRSNSPLNSEYISGYLICKDFKVLEKYSRITASCSIKFQDSHGGSAFGEFESSVFAQMLATGSGRAAQHPAMP